MGWNHQPVLYINGFIWCFYLFLRGVKPSTSSPRNRPKPKKERRTSSNHPFFRGYVSLVSWWAHKTRCKWGEISHSVTFWDHMFSRKNKVWTLISGSIGWVRITPYKWVYWQFLADIPSLKRTAFRTWKWMRLLEDYSLSVWERFGPIFSGANYVRFGEFLFWLRAVYVVVGGVWVEKLCCIFFWPVTCFAFVGGTGTNKYINRHLRRYPKTVPYSFTVPEFGNFSRNILESTK